MSRPQGHSAIGRILCQWKIPVTPAGVELATFRFVAQHLNHCATAATTLCQVTQVFHMQLFNLTRYWLQAPWGWHDSVETRRSVIIYEIIVHFLVTVRNNNKIILEFALKYSGMPQKLSISWQKLNRQPPEYNSKAFEPEPSWTVRCSNANQRCGRGGGGDVRQMLQTHGRKGEDDLEDLVADGKITTTLTKWKQCVRTRNRQLIEQNVQRTASVTNVSWQYASTLRHSTNRVQIYRMLFEIFTLLGCYAARSDSSWPTFRDNL